MKMWYVLLLSFIFAVVYYFVGGTPLFLLFSVLWFDKILLRVLPSNLQGIELTSLATILTGMAFGPIFGFIIIMLTIPLLEGIKSGKLTLTNYNIVDGIIAIISGILSGLSLLPVVMIVLFVKFMFTATVDTYFTGKVFDIRAALMTALVTGLIMLLLENMIMEHLI